LGISFVGNGLIGLVVAVTIFYHSPVQAAAPVTTAPIIFLINGDLWEVPAPGQPVQQLTHWGHNFNPVLSPDGQKVAYLSLPDAYVQSGGGSGSPPTNVWVYNLTTSASVRVADQPADTADPTKQFHHWINRPTPAWSPDSTQLAWVELASGSQLAIYDVASQKNMLTVDVPGYTGPGEGTNTGETVAWSSAGIAYTVLEVPGDFVAPTPHMTFYLYSTNGKQLIAQSLPEQTCGIYGWAQDSKTNKPVPLFCNDNTGAPSAFDLTRKITIPFPGRLTLYSSSGTGSGVTITCDVPPDPAIQACPTSCWPLGDTKSRLINPLLTTAGISPDGQNLVDIDPEANAAYTVYSGSSQTPTTYPLDVPGKSKVDWVGWGPTALKFTQFAGHEGTCPSS
jgi:hypothetical protein